MPRILLIAACAALLTAGCQTPSIPVDMSRFTASRMSEEEKVALVMEDVRNGMENRRIYQVLANISKNYRDREGRDYEALRVHLNMILGNYRSLRITRTPPRIKVQGNQARVVESFGTSAEPVNPDVHLPVNLQGQMVVLLEKNDGKWQIVEWGPLG